MRLGLFPEETFLQGCDFSEKTLVFEQGVSEHVVRVTTSQRKSTGSWKRPSEERSDDVRNLDSELSTGFGTNPWNNNHPQRRWWNTTGALFRAQAADLRSVLEIIQNPKPFIGCRTAACGINNLTRSQTSANVRCRRHLSSFCGSVAAWATVVYAISRSWSEIKLKSNPAWGLRVY